MTKRLARWLSLGIGAMALLVLLALLAVYWRLHQGPVSLPMLEPRVRAALQDSLRDTGLRVDFRDVVAEIGRDRLPTLRLRDLSLREKDSERILASAPRAAIGLDGGLLLRGRVQVRRLQLVGARLVIRRGADGALSFGMKASPRGMAATGAGQGAAGKGDPAGATMPSATPSDAPSTKDAPMPGAGVRGGIIQQAGRALAEWFASGRATLGNLESLQISNAGIEYHDEALNMSWQAPDVDLALRRVPYGYALLAKAQMRTSAGLTPLVISTVWRRRTGNIDISLRMHDVPVVSLLSRKASAEVSSLTGDLPLSASVSLGLAASGRVREAFAEILLGRGDISDARWLDAPLRVRGGLLRLDYRGEDNSLVIRRGELRLAQGVLNIIGSIGMPTLPQEGVQLALQANYRSAGGGKALLEVLRLNGVLYPWRQVLEVADLQLSGTGGAMRVRGMLRREAAGIGVYVAGRARDVSHRLLKAFWPPAVAAGARQWLRQRLRAGYVPRASFRLAIPGKVLSDAMLRDVPMPDDVADVRFAVAGVRFSYVDGWPDITDAAGEGRITGNNFRLVLKQGRTRLSSGRVLRLERGEMHTRDLAARISPATIDVRASGAARDFVELADMPPLRLRHRTRMEHATLTGKAVLNVRLAMPLHRDMQPDDVRVVRVRARLENTDIPRLAEGVSLSRGNLRLEYADGMLRVAGQARLADLPVRLQWQRKVDLEGGDFPATLKLKTRLDDATRRRLGVDLSSWFTGPVDMEANATLRRGRMDRVRVSASLDGVAMRLPAIGWSRPPRKGTKATFDVVLPEKGGTRIERLRLKGPGGLRVEGRLRLDRNGRFRDATFARFELDPDNRLALGLEMEGERLAVVAAGPQFDARALAARLFAPRQEIDRTLRSVFVRVNLQRVLMLRGQHVQDVRGEVEMRDGLVTRASLTGRFPSGGKVALDLVLASDGLRRLRIVSNDAGALLRASGLYSRVVGGQAEFTALLDSADGGGVRRGLLVMRRFVVRGDERLNRLRRKEGRQAGPRRRPGQMFSKLVLPFSTDSRFIRIGDAIIRSPEIGATANGMIRRADGAMDIGGVIIPAYAINAAFGKIPVLGALLTGGRGEGIFGMTYALKGSMRRPKFLVNPLSAVAPGVFRQFFHLGGQNVNPDGTPRRRGSNTQARPRSRNNLANGG